MKVTNKMQLYWLIYYSQSALHVSGNVFAHHQEHLTVFTVSGSIRPSSCWLISQQPFFLHVVLPFLLPQKAVTDVFGNSSFIANSDFSASTAARHLHKQYQ
jgi:hypothetical protein